MKKQESGYSLVEVLIALAITSIVLLTVVTLFYMGKKNVYSGKQMTYANSVGTRMLEDLSQMTAADVLANFNITDATVRGPVILQGTTYGASLLRDTSTCVTNGTPPPAFTCTNDTGGYLSGWRSLIDPAKLTNAKAGLILKPEDAVVVNNAWTTGRILKIRAFVQWDEGQRRRVALFDTSLVNRTE